MGFEVNRMDTTRSTASGAAAAPARAVVPAATPAAPVRPVRPAVAAPATAPRKSAGYGLPCSKCRLYYPANLTACPICRTTERVSAKAAAVKVSPAPVAPAEAVLDEERERFLREYKAKLYAAHAQINPAGQQRCVNADEGDQAHEQASVCKACSDRLQQRLDRAEAAFHIDLREATQIIYDAVWSDTSDSSKTYQNAAQAILTELRKRAGIDLVMGTLQARPH
jgi:hypothetical protein